MSDHSELIAEIATVEKMPTADRLKHAKKRRSQQLKRFANYEKQLEKDKSKKNKQSQNQKKQHRKRTRVKFIHNIMLLESAARSDLEEVRKLLMSGVTPDVTNEDGLTALHQCCIDDSEEMLKLLLEFGANVNAKDSEMWTPLHAAATCGHVHLCKLLIDKGAELLAVNADGNMPYDICEDEVCLDYIETEMAKRGVTQEEIDEKRLETEQRMLVDLKAMAKEGRDLDYWDRNRATPLHVAAANGYLDVVEFLLDHHVSLDSRDEDGWLPIHAAACWLQPEVLEILAKNGADLDAKTRSGETPFDLAEDPDVKQKILDLKDELENHRASTNHGHIRSRRNISTRGHGGEGLSHSHHSSTSSIYSSNTSLNEKQAAHQHSASIRRTSMRGEKKPLFKKEAKEEALHFGMFTNNEDDDAAENMDDNKENLPATNIDDVQLSFIEDEPDRHVPEEKQQNDWSEKQRRNKQDSVKNSTGVSPTSDKKRSSQEVKHDSQKPPEAGSVKRSAQKPADTGPKEAQVSIRTDSQKSGNTDNDKRKSETRKGYTPEPIHVHMERQVSSDTPPQRQSSSPSQRDINRANESRVSDRHDDVRDDRPAHTPQMRQVQAQGSTGGRVPSFRKNRDSVRQSSASPPDPQGSQPRYPTGTGPGTLADLKKHRAENHKFGNSLDAQVQNLFLHSLSSDGKKYSSSGGGSNSPQQSVNKDSTQNGRNVKNNNNNNPGSTRPPTYISDNGQLRRFSAPTSTPVIGEDDKFKSNCCVVM